MPIDGTMNAQVYLRDIPQPVVTPIDQNHDADFILVDDNARPHRARIVEEYLHEATIERMEWPPFSPDMNPIEHAWDMLHRAVQSRPNVPTTAQELRVAAVEQWRNLDQIMPSTI